MAIDPKHPGDLARDFLVEIEQRGCERIELEASLGLEHRLAGVEEHFRLEHEAVADDADIGPIAKNSAQPSEEIGSIARQLLDALSQSDVQALAEIGNLDLRLLVLLRRGVERVLQGRKLAAQRRDLLVEHLDLRQGAPRDLLFSVERAAQRRYLALGVEVSAAGFVEAFVTVALVLRREQIRVELGELVFGARFAGFLQRQELGELRDLRIETAERRVLAGYFLRQE